MPPQSSPLRAAFAAAYRRRVVAGLVTALLALGIGTSAAMFSVVRGVLLRPLPYPRGEELVWVAGAMPAQGVDNAGVSLPRFELYAENARALSSLGAFWKQEFSLTGVGEAERLQGARASRDLFRTLGVTPVLGRVFTAEEQVPGGALACMLGEGLWRTRFGAQRDVVGRAITVDGEPCTVVGVLPPAFTEPLGDVQLWMPRVAEPDLLPPPAVQGGAGYLGVIGRLRPGATPEQGRADLQRLSLDYRARQADMRDAPFDAAVTPLDRYVTADLRGSIVLLWAAGGFVFLIACFNAGNLLLTRVLARRTEFGVRAALGASRGAVVRQLLGESLALAAASIALGLVLAWAGLQLAARLTAEVLPATRPPTLDPAVCAFAAALGLLAVLLTALGPALRVTRTLEGGALVSTSVRGTGVGRGAGWWRRALVVGQVAVSFVLLAGALQQARELLRLQRMDRGFAPDGLLTFQVAPSSPRYAEPAARAELYRRVRDGVAALPGVRAAGASQALPVGDDQMTSFVPEAERALEMERRPKAQFRLVTAGYLEALGVSLVRGRLLRAEDDERAVPAVVVSASLAERHLGGTDVVGRRLFVGANPAAPPREIVGVVADVRPRWAEDAAEPGIYVPAAQMPIRLPPMTYLVRAAGGETDALHAGVRERVRAVDPDQAVTRLVAMPELFARGLAVPRLRAWLMLGLAVVGTLLACVGVWAVMAQAVLERGRDLSVRLALGAPGRAVVGEVVRGGLAMSAVGLALGAAGALAAMRLLGRVVEGVTAPDAPVLLAAGGLLLVVAFAAAWVPALRATRIPPFRALDR
ncbi:ADOP family duplicated permease [Roseisolibacter sp. H3M3-2]|uniref:ADOP family duplicated permease n=1 Tax=Roseisolibacter sp. H3M3-2 TaxID=3031323 RepID=UPI0023DB8BE2|nr:ADOP family duplicated permease [Roseisolibacter sp. H3M3-2]MDF1502737.1 ADOP family duplicated permease [Roseisolibacter sp. H3M3-2]